MVFAAYLPENAILVLSQVGQLHPTLSPTVEHLQLFQNKMTNAGGGGACFELTEPLNVGSTEVLCCFLENLTFPFVVTCAILVLLDYRKRMEELRSSKKQQRTAMHSKFSV